MIEPRKLFHSACAATMFVIFAFSGSIAMPARPIRPAGESLGPRIVSPSVLQGRRFPVIHSSQSTGFVIRDLGLPAVPCPPVILPNGLHALVRCNGGGSAAPGTFLPTPTAIDRYGNVAVLVCPGASCFSSPLTYPSYSAYVYDYRSRALIALATFAPASGKGPSPLPQTASTGVDRFVPNAMNDRGQIVGSVTHVIGSAITTTRPVIWIRRDPLYSTVAYLDAKPDEQGTAYGVNNLGVSVGSSRLRGSNADVAVSFAGAEAIPLAPNGIYNATEAFAINDAGVVAGDEVGFAGTYYGGVFTPIPTQDQCPPPFDQCDENSALAVNASNDVLGNYVSNYFDMASQSFVGFLYLKNSVFETLQPACFDGSCPPPFDQLTNEYVLALNNLDDFVGYFDGQPWVSFSPTGDANGLLPPNSGWIIKTATAINDRRQIVGQGYHAGFGQTLRAYLLEPQQ